MKKKILLLMLCGSAVMVCSAQTRVGLYENVGIHAGTNTPLSPLSVGHAGEAITMVSVKADGKEAGVKSITTGSRSTAWVHGVYGRSMLSCGYHYGISGVAYSSTPLNSHRAYGVMGSAGNSSDGWNYGVYASLEGEQAGTAVLGTVDVVATNYKAIPGRYAGYFWGPVHVTEAITAKAFTVQSDERYKKNIGNIGRATSLTKLLQLRPVEYELNHLQLSTPSDTAQVAPIHEMSEPNDDRRHFGLIAQQVQEVYPELVYEDGDGYLSVDYIGLIPLLIQSVQDLSAEVAMLKAGNAALQKVAGNVEREDNMVAEARLYQNTPNPFGGNTEITYVLPEEAKVAVLGIYDLNGRQVDSYVLNERGQGKLVLKAGGLPAGMYLYGLMVDGRLIDTKQMVVTE